MAIPVNSVLPVLSGLAEVGEVLTTTSGSWSGSPTSYARAWLRDGVLIAGANASTYTVGYDDVGAALRAQVIATNVDGDSLPALSAELSGVPSTLIVEDGTGFDDADSYASVADADAYHAQRGNEAWAGFTGAQKEQSLRKATEYLDGVYGARWLGDTYAQGQALDWPRSSVPLPERTTYWTAYDYAYLPVTPLPVVLLRATYELALKSGTGTDLNPDIGPAVKQETVGPLTVVYQDRVTNVIAFSAVQAMLGPLLNNDRNIRLYRG